MSTTAQPMSQSPAPMKLEAPPAGDMQNPTPSKAPSSSFHKDTPPSYTPKDAPPSDTQKPAPSSDAQKPPPSSDVHKTPHTYPPSSDSHKPASYATSSDVHKEAPSTDAQKKTTQPPSEVRKEGSSTDAQISGTQKESNAPKTSQPSDAHKEGTSPDKQNAAPSSDGQKSDTQKEGEAVPKRDPNMPKLRDDQMAHPTEIPPQPHPEKMQKEREEQKNGAQQGQGQGDQQEDKKHEDYPEQIHAGRVGYGPNYVNINGPPNVIDKIKGYKEEVKGKILRKPELVEQGHDRITGELKKKEKEKMDHEGPFAQKEDAEKKGEDDSEQQSKPSGRGGARIETHGESKPAHPDHRDSSYAHTSIADRHKSVNAEPAKAEPTKAE